MYSESRKIHLIEEVSKVNDETVLVEIEAILNNYNNAASKKSTIYDFVGIISKDEAHEMNMAISDSCETIDNDDWK